jgi:hypothetical protein
MRCLVIGTLLLTVLGCSHQPQKEGVQPVVPVSDPLATHEPDVFKELGLSVQEANDPYVRLDKEPAARNVSPHSPEGIVPVARLHERLSKMQIDSLGSSDPIVRFEVIDLEWKVINTLYQFSEKDDNGLHALALVYSGGLSEASVPLGAKRMILDVRMGGKMESATIDKLTVNLYKFELQPVGIKRTKKGDVTTVDIGTQDWKVDSGKRKAAADASHLIEELPVNDPSALAISRTN